MNFGPLLSPPSLSSREVLAHCHFPVRMRTGQGHSMIRTRKTAAGEFGGASSAVLHFLLLGKTEKGKAVASRPPPPGASS